MQTEHKIIAQDFTHFTPGTAFQQCITQNYTPAYMPELLRFKIAASPESNLWKKWYTSGSIIITGISKKSTPVVAFVHKENSLNNERRIKETVAFGLHNGAGIIPNYEFYKILEQQDDQQIFVVDYNTLYKNHQHEINVEEALSHPFVIPFCGGKKNAKQYLKKYHEVTKQNTIKLMYGDDPHLQPLARLLYLTPNGSFDGSASLESSNCLLGLKEDTLFASRSQPKNQPSLESLLQLAKKYIPPVMLPQYEEELKTMSNHTPNQYNQPNQLSYSTDSPPPLPSSHTSRPSPTSIQSNKLLNSPHTLNAPSSSKVIPIRALPSPQKTSNSLETTTSLKATNPNNPQTPQYITLESHLSTLHRLKAINDE